MGKKNLITVLGLLVLVGLVMGYPALIQADDGEGNFIFVNYIGQEIILDLDDVTYTVPGIDVAPDGGRLVLQLDSGEHKYAANAPGLSGGSAGEFTLAPGEVVAKAARIEQTPLKVDNAGTVIALPKDYVFVFEFDPFAAPVEPAPAVDTWQPVAAASEQGSLVWINYYGDGLTVDLAGTIYQVPPQTDGIPGRLQVDLAPGTYRYTASVPYGSVNGETDVTPGMVVGLNVTADIPEPIDYDLGDAYEGAQPVTLKLSAEDLTAQVSLPAVTVDAAPPVLPETGGEVILQIPAISPAGLVVKNYTGDTLVFTINDQTYLIANNVEQTLDVPPGEYNYTASLPFIATTGTIDLTGGGLELSIATDVKQGVLNVFQN